MIRVEYPDNDEVLIFSTKQESVDHIEEEITHCGTFKMPDVYECDMDGEPIPNGKNYSTVWSVELEPIT